MPKNKERRLLTVHTINFVFVYGGSTFLGSWVSENDRFPLIKVHVDDFFISETPITQSMFELVMGWNNSKFKGSELPVTNINFEEAEEFCSILNRTTPEFSFRLPTEAEWEYAAKANSNFIYSGSNHLEEVGWYEENSNCQLQAVKLKKPNAFGLYDMSGNVWEWCADYYRTRYGYLGWPLKKTIKNPRWDIKGPNKVVRGGCFLYSDTVCRVNQRSRRIVSGKCSYIGFRVIAKPLSKDSETNF